MLEDLISTLQQTFLGIPLWILLIFDCIAVYAIFTYNKKKQEK